MTHSRESESRVPSTRKYLGLQLLRITAAVMVLVTHSTFYVTDRLDKSFPVWKAGASGIEIFFVLSGFVMIFSSQRLLNDANGWKTFMERRLVRIVPMYWIATSLKVLALLIGAGASFHTRLGLAYIIQSYLFIPSYDAERAIAPVLSVGWTLNFEMFFYLVFAAALFFKLDIYKSVGLFLSLIAFGALFNTPGWPAASLYLDVKVLEFFYGMIIAKLCLQDRLLPKRFAIPLLLVAFVALIAPWSTLFKFHGLIHGVIAAAIIYAMASLEDWMTFVPAAVLYLADSSYAIYLFHPLIAPGVPAIFHHFHFVHPLVSVITSVVLALVFGSVIHWLIESPLNTALRKQLGVPAQKIVQSVTTA